MVFIKLVSSKIVADAAIALSAARVYLQVIVYIVPFRGKRVVDGDSAPLRFFALKAMQSLWSRMEL